MPYEIGDTEPPHISVHNELTQRIALVAERNDVDVVLPPIVSLGDTGHVNDHNLFTVALAEIEKECKGGVEFATVSEVEAATESIPVYTDANGITWKSWLWKNSRTMSSGNARPSTRDLIGSITTSTDGFLAVLIVAGGGSGYSNLGGGGAGGVLQTIMATEAGTHEIYVGSGDASSGTGGGSAVGKYGIGGGIYRSSGNSGNGFSGISSSTPGAGATGSPYQENGTWMPGPGRELDWADGTTMDVYGLGGFTSTSAQQPPGYGTGGTYQPSTATDQYNPGANGVVIVRVPVESAPNVAEVPASEQTQKKQAAIEKHAQAVQRELDENPIDP